MPVNALSTPVFDVNITPSDRLPSAGFISSRYFLEQPDRANVAALIIIIKYFTFFIIKKLKV
jgi:hypothetical protein